MASCPVHDDGTPSLSVRWVQGQRGGMVLLHCHGCGAPAVDLVVPLGLTVSDLFDEPPAARERRDGPLRTSRSAGQRRSGARRGKLGRLPRPLTVAAGPATAVARHEWVPVQSYPYEDTAGQLVQEVIREECASCPGRHKQFRQVFLDAGRRVHSKPPGFTPVLYRLPQLLAGMQAGQRVYLLEGEKDVHTAERLGLVATTNAQGSRAFAAELAAVLAGAEVRVVLDRDDAGWSRGVQLHAALTGAGARVGLFLPAPEAPKSDFTDHIDSGGTPETLLPVHVEEVAAWAGLAAVRTKAAAVEQTLTEAQAQTAAAEAAQQAGDEQAAAEHRRFARRWSAESELRAEALHELIADVRRAVARTGTEWAGRAVEAAEELWRLALTAARAAHDTVGIAVPPVLQITPAVGAGPGHAGRGGDAGSRSAPSGGGAGAVGNPEPGPEPRWQRTPDAGRLDGVAIEQPVFRIVNGQIVQLDRDRRSRREAQTDPEDGENLKLVLGLDVRIVEMEYLEDPDTVDVDSPQLRGREVRHGQGELNPPAPAELAAVVVAYTDPTTGEVMQLRIPADQYRDCGWLESLPGPPDYDGKPSGLATVRRAVKAVSTGIRRVTRYRWTGWRQDTVSGEWMYVHAGGAITAAGTRPVPVLLTGPLARYDLPDPCTDPGRLREAFLQHSGGMLDRLPARVAGPLLGHVWRAALGPNPWVLALIGSPGSYKTSLASLAMHHWGELWDRRKPASSMSGNGDTLNALRIKLNCAKDALYWADDVAPTRDWAGAQKTLEEFARLVHNGEQRSRSTRDGLSVLDGTPPRSSALVTSEVMPRPGSGAQRMLVVPLQAEEIELEALIALDADPSRHARALLMASMLQWAAGALADIRVRVFAEADRFTAGLRATGESDRQAEAVGQTWAGWLVMTEFLVAVGALSAAERTGLLGRVQVGLTDALAATADPDLPTRTGARVRELICHALRSGIAYVDDVRTGESPAWPLAGRLGWKRAQVGSDQLTGEPRYRTEARGIRFGYVLSDPGPRDGVAQLLVDSSSLEQVLKATAMTMADAPQIDRGTALRALHEEHLLIVEQRDGRTPRFTVKRTLHCEDGRVQRVTALRLTELLGDTGGEDRPTRPGQPPSGPPAPVPAPSPPTTVVSPAPAVPPVTTDVDALQQPELGSALLPPGLTSPPFQEQPVPTFADAEGLEAPIRHIREAQPCLLCGVEATVYFLDQPLHIPCWWRSTAASRSAAQARRDAAATPAAPGAPTVDGAPPATAAAASVPDGDQPVPDSAVPAPPPPGTAPTRPSARAADRTGSAPGRFTAPSAVLHTDGIWLADGSRRELPDPLRHVGHVAELVEQLQLGTQVTERRAEPGQIWLTGELMASLGVDPAGLPADPTKRGDAVRDLTRGTDVVTAAQADGWQLGGAGDCLGGWTRVWRGEQRGVWVALIPVMNADPLEIPVLADSPTPATLARRLALFADALRAPWVLSAATTGLDLMIGLRAKDRDRLFTPHDPVPPARISTLEQDLNWSRVPTEPEQAARFVHAYDRGGSYAAGAAGLELGIGVAQHHPDGCAFDPKLPGYWKIDVPPSGDWRMPHPLNPRGRMPERPVWVTTPALQLAYELGHEVPVQAAYTWPEHGRVLDPWYERVRDGRTALDIDDADAQAARNLLKVVYTRTIGMLGSEEWMRNRPGYAPDRRHHIVAKARSNILRRILQIGRDTDRWPVAVIADTVLYLSDDPDPVRAWPGKASQLGRGFGQFKPEASGRLSDQLPHLNGKDYRGKELLDHEWMPADTEPVP